MHSRLLIRGLLVALSFSVAAHANILNFSGPWAPADSSGNLINGYIVAPLGSGQSATVKLANNVVTIDFLNPNQSTGSTFSNFPIPNTLPSGNISYDWSVTFDQDGNWLFETDVTTDLPASDHTQFFKAGTYTGHSSYDFTTGGYFSYGNVAFGEGAVSAHASLSNFVFTEAAPEPTTTGMIVLGCLALAAGNKRLRAKS
jgi:hypothetical protein